MSQYARANPEEFEFTGSSTICFREGADEVRTYDRDELQRLSACCGAKEHEYCEGFYSACNDATGFDWYDADGNEVPESQIKETACR